MLWNLAEASHVTSLPESCFLGGFFREKYSMSPCMFTTALFFCSLYLKATFHMYKISVSCFLSLSLLNMVLYYLMLWINLLWINYAYVGSSFPIFHSSHFSLEFSLFLFFVSFFVSFPFLPL